MKTSPQIDLYFPIRGREIPVDHAYLLFAALSRVLESPENPWLHAAEAVGIHPIRGRYLGQGRLAIGPAARLGVRLSSALIARLLPLAGKSLRLGGDDLRLGIPQPHALKPAPNLYAHRVTTKNGDDPERFDAEIARQLEALEIHGRPQRGPRRVFTVRDRKVVAHTLLVTELTAEESIRLQETGLGGRRKLGCGVFVPWTR